MQASAQSLSTLKQARIPYLGDGVTQSGQVILHQSVNTDYLPQT
jgi:hypothetical protein